MFSSFKGFFERHRRKIYTTGAVLCGAYAVGKLAKWTLSRRYEEEHVELVCQSKKQFHFEGNQKTCNSTLYSLLPSLQDIVFKLANSEAITEKLKHKPADKLLLWEQLKICSFTRIVTGVYATSLLAVFLRVQLNLLGGYMYLDIEVEDTYNKNSFNPPGQGRRVYMTDRIQTKYLSIVRFFLESGVKDLVEIVEHVVEGKCYLLYIILYTTNY